MSRERDGYRLECNDRNLFCGCGWCGECNGSGYPRCWEHNPPDHACDEPGCEHGQEGKYGPNDERLCLNHGMALLERIRQETLAAMVDRCPDGPHCGCDYHRTDDEDE